MPKIEIIKTDLKVTGDEKVAVGIEMALCRVEDETEETDEDGFEKKVYGLRIPNIAFEVRTALVESKVAVSSGSGVLLMEDILIAEYSEGNLAQQESSFEIIAQYMDGAEIKSIRTETSVLITEQLLAIKKTREERRREEKQEEREKAQRNAERRVERRKKEIEEDKELASQLKYDKMQAVKKRKIKNKLIKDSESGQCGGRGVVGDKLKFCRKHQHFPQARKSALIIAKKRPKETIESVGSFKNAKWAEEVMAAATKEQPLLSIEYITKYKERPWALNIMKQAQATKSGLLTAFTHLEDYCDQWWCEELIKDMVGSDPGLFLRNIHLWEYQLWAKRIAIIITQDTKYTSEMVEANKLFMDQPWADSVAQFAKKIIEEKERKAQEVKRAKKELKDARAELIVRIESSALKISDIPEIIELAERLEVKKCVERISSKHSRLILDSTDVLNQYEFGTKIFLEAIKAIGGSYDSLDSSISSLGEEKTKLPLKNFIEDLLVNNQRLAIQILTAICKRCITNKFSKELRKELREICLGDLCVHLYNAGVRDEQLLTEEIVELSKSPGGYGWIVRLEGGIDSSILDLYKSAGENLVNALPDGWKKDIMLASHQSTTCSVTSMFGYGEPNIKRIARLSPRLVIEAANKEYSSSYFPFELETLLVNLFLQEGLSKDFYKLIDKDLWQERLEKKLGNKREEVDNWYRRKRVFSEFIKIGGRKK